MLFNVKPYLLNHLRLAAEHQAKEVRFVSGQQPSIKVTERLQPLGEIATSGDFIQAIHEVLLAERQGDQSSTTDYAVTLPEFGHFWCHFELRGNAKSLSLHRDPNETASANHAPRVSPPSLRGAAPRDEES